MPVIPVPIFSVDPDDSKLQMAKQTFQIERLNSKPIKKYSDVAILKCGFDKTLLHTEVECGNVKNTKLFIDAGFNVNAIDNSGKTPMMLALQNYRQKPLESLQIIEILCKANANIYVTDKCGKSAVQLLLDNSSFIDDYVHELFLNLIQQNCNNDSQKTAKKLISLGYPLWHVVLLGNVEVIEHMIICGCPINHHDKEFMALNRAVQYMNLDIVKVLIKYNADVDLHDHKGRLPIFYYNPSMHSFQQPEFIKILLNETALLRDLYKENEVHQLSKAFECGNKEVIKILLEYHNDILNIRDVQGQTPLHYLCRNYHPDVFKELKNRKMNVNVQDAGGRTPLFIAVQNLSTHVNAIQFLLENGAELNVKTKCHDVALFCLCKNQSISKKMYCKIIEIFLQYNLDIQIVGLNQETVFDIIMQNQSFFMVEPLLAYLVLLEESNKFIVEYIKNKINSHKYLKDCYDGCKAELIKMKSNIINNKLTLYMIVVKEISDEKILKCCRFSSNSLLELGKSKKQFQANSYYNSIVHKRISFIVSKLELLKKAAFILCKLLNLGNNPNNIVITEILDYLNIQDLQTLIEVKI